MNAPLTTASFKRAGVRFRTQRQETAAGYVTAPGYTITARGERRALLNWMLMHRQDWPAEWDDAEVAARLPVVLDKFAPRVATLLAAALAALDDRDARTRYQDELRAA